MTLTHESVTVDTVSLRNRERMLAKVKRFWVSGVLEESLKAALHLKVQLQYDPQAVAPTWEIRPLAGSANTAPTMDRFVPGDCAIADVFDEAGGELLILGAPGSGKTTLLLELAQALIQRAETDATLPMPVVFNLSSWAEKSLPLKSWLVDELNIRYQVPTKIGGQWIDSDALLLLLDGLDEVEIAKRDACVEAINAFRQELGFAPVVVCSRIDDYAALKNQLRLQEAVVLQPLLPAQVDSALRAGGSQFDVVRAVLDEDAKLKELITSPLMLGILALAYGEQSATDLRDFDTLEERRTHLFDRYIERMLSHRGSDVRYSTVQIKRQLAWLARDMSRRAQMIFSIESLQPDALPPRGRTVHALVISLLLSLSFGLVIGVTAWLISLGWWFGNLAPLNGVVGGLGFGIAIGVGYWVTSGGSFGITLGVATGLAVGLPTALSLRSVGSGVSAGLGVAVVAALVGWYSFGRRGTLVVSKNAITVVEILSWSWKRAILSFVSVLAVSALGGITLYPIVYVLDVSIFYHYNYNFSQYYSTLFNYGLSWGVGVGLIAGL
ncbi:MAG TPA: NACHT domain-containing protein, partial [Aggregatilineales bacterium]|nr:NACHT domain-containing protein [Aggregatilineales bacterium]